MAVLQQASQQMREAARIARDAEATRQTQALGDAASQMRQAANERMAGAIVAGAMQIAGGFVQLGAGLAAGLQAMGGAAAQAKGAAFSDTGPGRPIENTVGVTLSIPLYAGGGISSQVTEKVQLEQKARHDFEDARRQAVQSARLYYNGVLTGLARVRALEAGEKSSRAAVQANQTGYELGVRINLDVLNAQQQLYATQRDLAQARYGALLDSLRLKAVSGILSEADLDAVNRLLRLPRN